MEEELKEYRTKTEELEGQVEVANADKMQYDSERMFEEKYIIQLKQEIENIQYLLQQNEQDRE